MRSALTIAGSDSGGGAGIQADLKSFAAVGVHGTSVITCVTAQNTKTVASIFPLPVNEIRAQLRAVLEDFDVRGAKTGMLYSADIVAAVAEGLSPADFPLVVDPVMVATVGARLERDDFRDALVERLLPRAALVTPNRHEAERLAGRPVRGLQDMEAAARDIHLLGAHAVLVKGGHVAGELVDVLYDGRTLRRLRGFRYAKDLHGAGCTLAASVAAYLAQGRPLLRAVEAGRRRVALGFLASYRAGHGVEIINSHVQPDRYEIWLAVTRALPKLEVTVPRGLVPKGGTRIGYALAGGTDPGDVCAPAQPIAVRRGRLIPAGPATFGGSPALARDLLDAMIVQPDVRAAATLKTSPQNARRLGAAGLRIVSGRRAGGWNAAGRGVTPDAVVRGTGGTREARMIVLGRNPDEVVRKVRRMARVLSP